MNIAIDPLGELTPLQRSALALSALRARLDAVLAERNEPIAVIGIGCRFAGANGPDEFWQLLANGVDAVGEMPRERWPAAPDDPPHLRSGSFLDEVDGFDAGYFGITPREAAAMDPQQRLLLEVAVEALEDAGVSPASLTASPTGVFVGAMTNDYAHLAASAPLEPHTVSGVSNAFLAGRLAYILGVRGPALSVSLPVHRRWSPCISPARAFECANRK